MMLFVLFHIAQAEEILLRIAVNDSEQKMLERPVLVVENKTVPLYDDGSLAGDLAEDRIWVTTVFVEKKERVSMTLGAQGSSIGEITALLPDDTAHTIQLKTSPNGILIDAKAPKMPWEGSGFVSLNSSIATASLEFVSLGRVRAWV